MRPAEKLEVKPLNELIEHRGRVIGVSGDTVDVEIVSESACASCKARSACGMSESENKLVTVVTDMAGLYKAGEEVMVSVRRNLGVRAVIYAYVFPFFVMLAVLLVLVECGVSETVSGLAAIGGAGLYYFVLWLLRGRLEREITFNLRKL